MSGPTSWLASLAVGLAGAILGYLIFTVVLGIGDTDIFDWGGILSAIIGTLIVLGLAGYFLRRRIEQLGPGRGKPGGVGQPLVHGPAGPALLGPIAAGHQRVHLAPVAGGQPGGGGRLGPEQPGGAGVALDGRALGPPSPSRPDRCMASWVRTCTATTWSRLGRCLSDRT